MLVRDKKERNKTGGEHNFSFNLVELQDGFEPE
jgi:hypothetical protein